MLKVFVSRVFSAVLVLLSLVAIIFILEHASPIDPARAIVGVRANEAVVHTERVKLWLDRPLPLQYVHYLDRLVHGDLGLSAVTRKPVLTNLGSYSPASLELIVAAMLFAIALGVFFGVATAQGLRGSGTLRAVMVVASSLPVFLAAMIGIIVFYQKLGWLPGSGRTRATQPPTGPTGFLVVDSLLHGRLGTMWDAGTHLILPAVCLALAPAVAIGRVLRSSLQQTLRSEYVRTARAKGLKERRVMIKHALRNSANPVLAIGGLQIAAMFASLIVVEEIFAWPGLGQYAVQAIDKGDFATVAGITLTLGAIFVAANLIVDLLQLAADPRIRR
jgi:peptide/nickel transport system permease protein